MQRPNMDKYDLIGNLTEIENSLDEALEEAGSSGNISKDKVQDAVDLLHALIEAVE